MPEIQSARGSAAHTAETIEAIVRYRIGVEMLLRCALQGCLYLPAGGPCQFCGTPQREPEGEHAHG